MSCCSRYGVISVNLRLDKIVSGGQTGADRAGLDAAMKFGLAVGGYCPKGRLAEDGTVPEHYPLVEMAKGGYSVRTERNVIESDGTLILNIGKLWGDPIDSGMCQEAQQASLGGPVGRSQTGRCNFGGLA